MEEIPTMSKATSKQKHRPTSFNASYSAQGRDFIKPSWKGNKYAFCEICACDFSISHGGISDVKIHLATAKHKTNAEIRKSLMVSRAMMSSRSNPHNPMAEGAVHAELLFQGFVLQHNLPFAVNDSFSKLVGRMFPDSAIAKKYACGHTKASHLIHCIGKESIADIKKQLSQSCSELKKYYSLSTDGSSDKDDKYFPILITFEDSQGLIRTCFLDMPTINHADTKNIATAIEECLSESGLSLNSCAAFVSDNASVMTGKHNGILKLLQEKQTSGRIYGVGCSCHLVHLAAKHGAKALSFDPHDFLVDIYYHFEKNAERKELLREDNSFCNETIRKVLKYTSTRWLSISHTLERVLSIWDGLRCYFLSHYDDDSESGPSKRRKTGGTGGSSETRERRLANIFKVSTHKLYVLFLRAVTPHFEAFNILLQREKPMIHKLHPAMVNLYQELLSCFIKPAVIRENKDELLSIDITKEEFQKTEHDLFIGFAASQLIKKQDLEGSPEVAKFRAEVRRFYQKTLEYMKKKFPLDDPVLKAAVVFDPLGRENKSFSLIESLLAQFPDVLPEGRENDICMEFMLYQSYTDLPVMSPEEVRIDQFWHQVSKLQDPATGQPQFRLLSQLAKYIFLIPHSNAFCECIFSMFKKNTSEVRSSLGKSAEGHASTGAYAEHTGIRNSLCAVMAAKINLFKSSKCTDWSPTSDLIQKLDGKKRANFPTNLS